MSKPLRGLQVVLALQLVLTLALGHRAVRAAASLPQGSTVLGALSPYRWVPSHPVVVGLLILTGLWVAVDGRRPRLTVPLQLWITAWFPVSCSSIADGGDYIAGLLLLELLPAACLARESWARNLSFHTVRVQMSLIYLSAGVAKLQLGTWRGGTALYGYVADPLDGLRNAWAQRLVSPVPIEHALAWVTPVLEILLAGCLLAPRWYRRVLLPLGVLLHLGIGLGFGLYTFQTVMVAGLVVLTVPWIERPWAPANAAPVSNPAPVVSPVPGAGA